VTSTVRLRQPQTSDHEAIARLLTRAYPTEPTISTEVVAWSFARADPARPQGSAVAELDGAVIGSGYLRGVPSMAGLMLNVEVDPDHRRRGIGSRLVAAVLAEAGQTDLAVWTMVSEADIGSLAFMAHHGFVERDRMFESALALRSFEPDAFADVLDTARSRGIRFVRFIDVDTPRMRRRLHRLTNELNHDVPARVAVISSSYEEWVGAWLEAPHSRPDLVVVAFDGEEPVAVSSIIVTVDGTALNQMSGVRRSHRGLGLGLAVKVEALRRAREAGITEIRTDNHVRNAPMLAINARLGYRRLPGYIELARATA
jgi:GNAT superfamily N-acetyltransferase